MFGFLVGRGCLGAAIGFNEHKTRRIILMLKNIEAGDSGFLHARASIGERNLLEGINVLGLQVNVDVDNEHNFVKSLNRYKGFVKRKHAPECD